MKYTTFLVLAAFVITACGTTQKVVKPQPVQQEKGPAYDESFDPLSLNDEDIVIHEDKEEPAPQQIVKPQQEVSLTSAVTEVDGFRVQLLATRSIEAATMVKQQAEEQFATYGHQVYWSFEAPFYKVRVGDVLKRNEAEAIRDLARQMGYKQAFPVRSKVKPPQEKE